MPGGQYAIVDQAKTNLKKLEQYITTGMEDTKGLALDMVDQDRRKSVKPVEELKQVMLEYVQMEQELNQFLNATEDITRRCRSGECDGQDLEKLLQANLAEMPVDKDFAGHESYLSMLRQVDDLQNAGDDSMASEPEATVLDDDMAMTQEINTKCPYTGKDMVQPVQNKLCKHNYDKEGITEAMKRRVGKTKCPVPGCINDKPISADDLEDNRKLKRFMMKRDSKK